MSSLREWSGAVQEVIARLWPEHKIRVRFKPNFDLSLGDISSECCILLAAALRSETPEAIAAKIFEYLPRGLHGEHRVHAGFLNIRFPDDPDFLSENEPPQQEEAAAFYTLITPPLMPETSGLPGLRLAARAVLRFALLAERKLPAELRCGSSVLRTEDPAVAITGIVRVLLGQARSPDSVHARAESREKTRQALLSAPAGSVSLFMPPQFFSAEEVRGLHREIEAHGGSLSVWCPEKRWMFAASAPALPAAGAEEELRNLLVYLATDLPAQDLDFSVPALPERSNLPRYLKAVEERARLIRAEFSAADLPVHHAPQAPDPHFDSHLRRLLLRRRYLRTFYENAALHGELSPLLCALDDFAHTFTSVCNAPSFRGSAQSAAERRAKEEIVTGVSAALSDIIGGAGLFSDRAYVNISC